MYDEGPFCSVDVVSENFIMFVFLVKALQWQNIGRIKKRFKLLLTNLYCWVKEQFRSFAYKMYNTRVVCDTWRDIVLHNAASINLLHMTRRTQRHLVHWQSNVKCTSMVTTLATWSLADPPPSTDTAILPGQNRDGTWVRDAPASSK